MAALGRPGYITLGHGADLHHDYSTQGMEQHAYSVLDAAWEAGIRYFDTARSYGRGEVFLGSWLHKRAIPFSEVMVGSKWGYTYTAGWKVQAAQHEVKEHSLPVLNQQWEESQSYLDAYLGLYQIHSATLESGVLDNASVLRRLAVLKAKGTVIGLSLSGANQAQVLEKAMEINLDGIRLFDAVQATYNLLEPSAGPILATAHTAGMGVIVKEALANGRLTHRNQHPAFAPQLSLLQQEAKQQKVPIDALALAGVLAQPWADIVLSGAAQPGQLRSNLKALTVPWDAGLTERLSSLQESPEVYWQKRKDLNWN